jgi:two-component system phosphate regulon sensor histidine kinase PhoR
LSAEGILWALLAITLLGWVVSTYSTTRRATRMIIRLAQSERALQEARQRESAVKAALDAERALVARLPDPLLVLRPDRSVQHMNAAARSALGPGVPSLLRHPAFRAALERAQAEGEDQFAELSLPVPVARELHATVLAPAPESGGRLVAVLSDRTRDRAVERMRADFVANVSHELRTPLASLIGFIETLRGPAEDDPAARARFLAIMAEQSERMRRLIDDLLGLSRIELTEHQPPTGRAVPAAIARAEAEAMEPLLNSRGVRLELALDEAVAAVPADAEQVAQVVRNLLENAVRHGREGGHVQLSVARAGREATPGGHRLPARPGVLISVTDDGPGIPKAHIPRLTERFYRVDRGRARSAGGTGLGLAIVKHIVNRHRGQLLIESEEGVGSSFRVWLPAAAAATAAQTTVQQA